MVMENLALTRVQTQAMQSIPSCYTDYAIPAAKYWYTLRNFLCTDTRVFDWLAACGIQTAKNQGGTPRYVPFHFGRAATYLNPPSPSPESTGKKKIKE
jgi:hypothetical protein